jgi:hypothetical protein
MAVLKGKEENKIKRMRKNKGRKHRLVDLL